MTMAVRLAYSNTRYAAPPARMAFAPTPNTRSSAAEPVTLLEHLRTSQPFATRQTLARGQSVFSEGDSTDQVFELVSGTVRITKLTPGGRRHILDFIMPGELFGLIEHAEHTTNAECVGEVVVISYSRSQLDKLTAVDPVVRRRVLQAVSDSLLTAQQQQLILGCQDAREKLATFFLRLADRTQLKPGNRLELPMGRQDIADHLGLTIETVCRTVRAMHRAGIVTVPNVHEMTLSNIAALRALAVEI